MRPEDRREFSPRSYPRTFRSSPRKFGALRILRLSIESSHGSCGRALLLSDRLCTTNRVSINTLAMAARLPTLTGIRDYVETGGLMSYGPNFSDVFRRAAEYVDKILRGAKTADLPVEQPTKFDLVINLIRAKALGLDIPPSLLARADEVIE